MKKNSDERIKEAVALTLEVITLAICDAKNEMRRSVDVEKRRSEVRNVYYLSESFAMIMKAVKEKEYGTNI